MALVVWRPLSTILFFLIVSVEHRQAANVGGSDQNVVNVETTTEEVTTPKGFYVNSGPMNLTVQSGTKVTLHCRVEHNVANDSVSWLKRNGVSHLELLTLNHEIYRDDPRYSVNFIKPTDWQLIINPVNSMDEGRFECQISSHPPVVHFVYLHVLEMPLSLVLYKNSEFMTTTEYPDTTEDAVPSPIEGNDGSGGEDKPDEKADKEVMKERPGTVYIYVNCSSQASIGQPIQELNKTTNAGVSSGNQVPELEIADERNLPIKNKFYNSGSTIELKCLIVKVPQPRQFIIWKHNSTILNYDTTRGGISVKTEMLPGGAKSQLFIANVGPSDSGNYSCALGEEAVTWVSVVVITGETPAAMQHGSATTSASLGLLTILSAVLSAVS